MQDESCVTFPHCVPCTRSASRARDRYPSLEIPSSSLNLNGILRNCECWFSSRRRRAGKFWGRLRQASGVRQGVWRSAPPTLRRRLRRFLLLAWGQHSANDRRVQFILALADIAAIVFHAQDEDWQRALFVEIPSRHRHRQNTVQSMLAISSFVAVLSDVPCEDANLIVVVRQAVVRFGDRAQVL